MHLGGEILPLGRLLFEITNQGLSLLQEGHCLWQDTFNGTNTRLPTKQTRTKKKTENPAIVLMEGHHWRWWRSRGTQLSTIQGTVLFIRKTPRSDKWIISGGQKTQTGQEIYLVFWSQGSEREGMEMPASSSVLSFAWGPGEMEGLLLRLREEGRPLFHSPLKMGFLSFKLSTNVYCTPARL